MTSVSELQGRLRAQGAPRSHLDRIADLVLMAESSPHVMAMFLVGSYAKGIGDRVSDLDLVAIATPGHEQTVLSDAYALLQRYETLNQFTGSHPRGGSFWKLVYLDFSSVEFHVFDPSTKFQLKRPYLTVWDPADLLVSYVADGEPVRHEDFAVYEYGDQGLIWELVDCIKWLSRGRSELAKNHIRKLAAKLKPDIDHQ